jgi:hypothetical protein
MLNSMSIYYLFVNFIIGKEKTSKEFCPLSKKVTSELEQKLTFE